MIQKQVLSALFFFTVIFLSTPKLLIASQCTASTHPTPFKVNPQTNFIPAENIYCIVVCNNLTIKENVLTIDWTDPTGALRGQTLDEFQIPAEKDRVMKTYQVKLPKKGHVSRMLTGSSYGDEMYGTWTYTIHLNGKMVFKNHFAIH